MSYSAIMLGALVSARLSLLFFAQTLRSQISINKENLLAR